MNSKTLKYRSWCKPKVITKHFNQIKLNINFIKYFLIELFSNKYVKIMDKKYLMYCKNRKLNLYNLKGAKKNKSKKRKLEFTSTWLNINLTHILLHITNKGHTINKGAVDSSLKKYKQSLKYVSYFTMNTCF